MQGFREFRKIVRDELAAAGIQIDDQMLIECWLKELAAADVAAAMRQHAAWLDRRAADFAALAAEGGAA